MTGTSSLPSRFVVVLLDDLWISGDLAPKGEVLAVDRPLRNDWIGSKLARDATDDELEQFRADELEIAAEAAAEATDTEAEKPVKKSPAK